MRPPPTTVEQAAAAYLMKHAGATALLVLDRHTDQPIAIITQADITRAVADGKDVNRVRIYDLMTTRPAVISTATGVRDAAGAAPEVQDVLVAFAAGWPGRNCGAAPSGSRRGWTGAAREASGLAGTADK